MKNQAVADELARVLTDAAREEGRDLLVDAQAVRAVIAASVERLAASVGQPGYRDAVIAERDAVALASAVVAVDSGDAADRRLLGIIEGALTVGARMVLA